MNSIRFFAVLCSMLLITELHAQNTVQMSGRISTRNGLAVPRATIHLLNSNFIAIADSEGKYVLQDIPAGKYSVQVRALNYSTLTREIDLGSQQTEFNFELTEHGQAL